MKIRFNSYCYTKVEKFDNINNAAKCVVDFKKLLKLAKVYSDSFFETYEQPI